MIARTSSGKAFGGLARYLEAGRSGRETERVDWTTSRNLPTDEPRLAASLMQATAAGNVRVEQPVYHLSLSFDQHDAIDRPRMEAAADRLLRDLNLHDHQALLVAHKDRAHPHVHIVVNRVHPETHLAWERWQDRPRIEQTLRETEREFGLREVPGRLYREPGQEVPDRALDTSGERRFTDRTGEPSFRQRVAEHLPALRESRAWDDLERRLAAHGLRLEPKGQGLVITDGEHYVKASRVARDLSINRLEAKFDAPYPGRAPHEPGPEVDPAIRGLVRDVRVYEQVVQHHRALAEARECTQAITEHAHDLNRAARDWRASSGYLDQAFGHVYRAPAEARALVERFAEQHGPEATTRALRDHPDAFGALRTVDRKAVLGLVTLSDSAPARTAATTQLPDMLAEYRASADRLRSLLGRSDAPLSDDRIAAAQHAATVAIESAKAQTRQLHDAGRDLPDRRTLQRSIGELTGALSCDELRTLRSCVTDAQSLVAFKLRDAVRDIARDRHRDHGMGL